MTMNAISFATNPAQQLLQSLPLKQGAAANAADAAEKPSQAQEQQASQIRKSGPVMNVQGQATGTYIDTTA